MKRILFAIPLLLVIACSPLQQPYQDTPAGHAHFEGDRFYPPDGTPLPYRIWQPESGWYKKHPKAVIVAVHGFNDYSEAFEGPGAYFSQKGYAMYAYDQRGFGASPNTGIWAGQDNLVSDLSHFIRSVQARHPGAPLYIMGESMGGAVAIVALSDPDFPKVDGAILIAPAIWGEDTMNLFYRATLWLAAHTIPSYEMTGSDLKILASNNIPMLRRMSLDPLVIKRTRVDAVYGIVRLMDSAYENIASVNVPVLLLYGSEDQVIPSDPIQRALKRFKHPVRYAYYPGSYHMMLRDLQGKDIQSDILKWVKDHDTLLPSPGYKAPARKKDAD